MIPIRRPIAILGVLFVVSRAAAAAPASRPAAAERSFTFTYAATVTGVPADRPLRVWLPVPQSDETQRVEVARSDLPAPSAFATEPRFGNRVLSFDVPPGHGPAVPFSVDYHVIRRAVTAATARCPVPTGAAMSDPAALLGPDARVPVGGRPAELLAGLPTPADPTAVARQLYDLVDDRLAYRKDRPGWGTGDATWACDSRFGNCTDFHSLYISLARTRQLPSAFQIGFPIGVEPAGVVKGYHCWAWTRVPAGWLPVDVSEANLHPDRRAFYFGHLDADRVAFTVGRDLDLVPRQAGPPVNFFVYPYAEAAGAPVPQERVAKAFSYRPGP